MLACIAPLTRRTAISIHSAVAMAVAKKLRARPQKPISKTGLRPRLSERAPSSGEPKKLAMLKVKVTTPYQKA